MARFIVFFGLVAAGVAGALFVISDRAALTHVGYRVASLEREHRRALERNRKLEAEVAQLRTPRCLVQRIEALGLDLIPPEEALERERAAAAARTH